MHDLVITGATIVDGTGRAPFTGDVAVRDGRIAEVGKAGPGKRTLSAAGAHVMPGFVDIHTHFDGQVSWDEELSPSSLHGVTTCVMGSCGVGFAPVRPGREAALVELMEGVEDIPGSALAEGIPWGWESFADYLDALAQAPRTIDVLAQVPHDPLRMYVMGEDAEQRVRQWYARFGLPALFLSRFLPAVRAVVPPLAGAIRVPATGAVIAIATASTAWYAALAIIAYRLSAQWDRISQAIGQFQTVAAIVAGSIVVVGALVWWLRRRRRRA